MWSWTNLIISSLWKHARWYILRRWKWCEHGTESQYIILRRMCIKERNTHNTLLSWCISLVLHETASNSLVPSPISILCAVKCCWNMLLSFALCLGTSNKSVDITTLFTVIYNSISSNHPTPLDKLNFPTWDSANCTSQKKTAKMLQRGTKRHIMRSTSHFIFFLVQVMISYRNKAVILQKMQVKYNTIQLVNLSQLLVCTNKVQSGFS